MSKSHIQAPTDMQAHTLPCTQIWTACSAVLEPTKQGIAVVLEAEPLALEGTAKIHGSENLATSRYSVGEV